MDNLTEFQQRACAVGVVKMLSGTSFSICDLDALGKAMGRKSALAGKDYEALRSVHCVNWADMGPELTAMVRDSGHKLDRLGDWAVICTECSKTHKCVAVPLDTPNA